MTQFGKRGGRSERRNPQPRTPFGCADAINDKDKTQTAAAVSCFGGGLCIAALR